MIVVYPHPRPLLMRSMQDRIVHAVTSVRAIKSAPAISHSVGCRRSLFFTQDVGIDISSRSAQTWQHFCFHDSLDLDDEKDSSSLPGDRDTGTWTKQDSLALLGQGRVRI